MVSRNWIFALVLAPLVLSGCQSSSGRSGSSAATGAPLATLTGVNRALTNPNLTLGVRAPQGVSGQSFRTSPLGTTGNNAAGLRGPRGLRSVRPMRQAAAFRHNRSTRLTYNARNRGLPITGSPNYQAPVATYVPGQQSAGLSLGGVAGRFNGQTNTGTIALYPGLPAGARSGPPPGTRGAGGVYLTPGSGQVTLDPRTGTLRYW